MGEVIIDRLEPGESVELKATLMVGEPNPKWWQIWRPIIWREATQKELKKLAQAKKLAKAPKTKDGTNE